LVAGVGDCRFVGMVAATRAATADKAAPQVDGNRVGRCDRYAASQQHLSGVATLKLNHYS
jgi:hypothetical protein